MLTVDLCAGAGGLTRGLLNSGFDVAVAVELNRYAASSYRANFPSVDLIQDDIRSVSADTIRRKIGERGGRLEALVAGLPCQGFSESNRRTRTPENPRNQLYRVLLNLVKELRPRWFLVENVAGLATLESGRFLETVLRRFRSAGYGVACVVLNAADFGIPQVRRRTFLIGRSGDGENPNWEDIFKPPRNMKVVTVRDAISDLAILRNAASLDIRPYRKSWADASDYAKLLRGKSDVDVSGNVVSRSSPIVLSRFEHVPQGGNWSSIPAQMMRNYANREMCHTGIYHRLQWNIPSKVIGNFRKNMLIHPSQQRGLSVREAARLQSFPDRHVFIGPLNDRQQQVGDAVPPKLAEVVGRAILRADLSG